MRLDQMRPYRWYDPAEVIEDAYDYVQTVEDREHGEKKRMYAAMSDENHRMRLMVEHLTKELVKVTPFSPPQIIMTATEAAEKGMKWDR